MNSLPRSLIGTLLKTKISSTNYVRNFSAVPGVDSEPTNNTKEPDKLYKLVELELRGNEPAVLKSFVKFATTAANHLNVECKSWNMRKPIHERYTVLKAAHIYKKHRVQYETRTYYNFIQCKRLTGSTADTLLEYIERNLPEGVALKATKIEIQRLPDYFKPPEVEVKANNTS
ncbi:28S ribosomal protein S10, mitochondrial [Photinus pyralis]|uniref:28S ribosomal protein S10, mitochondrial n=1 Tax=Photinus pyralis TaxID=7054 RepID=UPI00126703C2|nr:28S ribosomal protein S10, mitochondrial [Photinus pyralis]